MIAIIFKRKNLPDDSLLLSGLNEDGSLQEYKIPGIIKSKKRSAFFLVPGTIWNFTVPDQEKDIQIPKETNLVYTPFDTNPTFKELDTIAELMAPLEYLLPGVLLLDVFSILHFYIREWHTIHENLRQELLNHFYLFFLEQMGQLQMNDRCTICEKPLIKTDSYVMHEGPVCQSCIQAEAMLSERAISWGWVKYYTVDFSIRAETFLNGTSKEITPVADKVYQHVVFQASKKFRTLILGYLKYSLAP